MSTAHAYDESFVPRGGEVGKRGGTTPPTCSRSVKVIRAFERADDTAVGGVAIESRVAGDQALTHDNRSDVAHRSDKRAAESEARRWSAFLALAETRGVSSAEVVARFTAEDIADLCASEHDETMLARCMDTLAEAVRLDRALSLAVSFRQDEYRAERPADGTVRYVRCADCRHFRRRASHPHLGDCADGVSCTAAGGFWDDQRRGCGTFAPSGLCPPLGDS